LFVHIGDPSSNQATSFESQVIHMIQELFGQTLRGRATILALVPLVLTDAVAGSHPTSCATVVVPRATPLIIVSPQMF
jgi:hypothetical protein